ncbi:MAG: acyltransferase [Prevotellaceae bacterium]|jgi:peptidoglycan/LPS O-acetylase OafA/YrhL|nr:acyltransferase [Prevotellaceae bacterium]
MKKVFISKSESDCFKGESQNPATRSDTNPSHTKPHYEILDGLRGIAAIMVLAFHVFEAYYVTNPAGKFDQVLNHAYLAVDFFFVLSGFVIGYAYDDRWNRMSIVQFLKRRIFRLHPMVIFGTALGVVMFYFGASAAFPLIQNIPLWQVLLYAVLGILMIPTPPSIDIRGWQEMYTLDAPTWTLAFEYFANLLYALFIRRFSRTMLTILVTVAACLTLHLTLTQGDVIGGWTVDAKHMYVGFTRLMYPFFAGLLLYRLGRVIRIPQAFAWSSLLLVTVLVIPRLGGTEAQWKNGIYEAAVILAIFPLIVAVGAGGKIKGKRASRMCKLLGDISYPVYLVNYPICYVHTGWASDTGYTLAEAGWVPYIVFTVTLLISYAAMRFYDIPVRKWLRKF